MNSIDVSIIICTYKRLDLAVELALREELDKPSTEVIVVEQGGTPVNLPKTRYTYLHTPTVSLPAARNLGLQHAKGRAVLFLDDDIEPTENLISAHAELYDDTNVVGVAGRVINDGQTLPENTNLITGTINKLGTAFTQEFYSTKKQTVDFPYGCNMSFRRSALEKVGGFDEKFLPPLSAFEEIDLALRIKKSGKIVFSPKAMVYHHKAVRGGTRISEKLKMIRYWNSYGYFLSKHIHFPYLAIAFLIGTKRVIQEYPFAFLHYCRGMLDGMKSLLSAQIGSIRLGIRLNLSSLVKRTSSV